MILIFSIFGFVDSDVNIIIFGAVEILCSNFFNCDIKSTNNEPETIIYIIRNFFLKYILASSTFWQRTILGFFLQAL